MKVYIASPLGFTQSGREWYYGQLIPSLPPTFEVLDPWKLTDSTLIDAVVAMPYGADRQRCWSQLNHVIGRNNASAISECHAVLAVLDGSDVDSGTAAEIGYACALNKLVVGYRSDFRLAGDNEGARVNLQVEYFIKASGGHIHGELNTAIGQLSSFRDQFLISETERRIEVALRRSTRTVTV